MRRPLLSVPLLGAVLGLTGLGMPAAASEEADPARGPVKIEDSELGDADNPNEVKVGCDFSVEFFGTDEGSVPVTFTLQPPSGDEVVAREEAQLREARGRQHSGSLVVDLTDDLADVTPAQAEDFDYKVRVDAEVKQSEGNDSITKSAMLFIVCEAAPAATVAGDEGPEVAGVETAVDEEPVLVPVGGVSAGAGGSAGGTGTMPAVVVGAGLLLADLAGAGRRLRA